MKTLIVEHRNGSQGEVLGFLGGDVGLGMVIVKLGDKLDKWPFIDVRVVTPEPVKGGTFELAPEEPTKKKKK